MNSRTFQRWLPQGGRFRLGEFLQNVSLPLAWLVLIGIFGALRPAEYLSIGNFASIFGSQAAIAVLALGLVIVLRVGEFDLSVAATMTLGSVLLTAMDVFQHTPPILAVALTLLAGGLVGLANGVLVAKLGIDSFIATLGVATIIQGIALWVTNLTTIVGLSEVYIDAVVLNRIAGIPLAFYYAVIATVVLTYMFRYTILGRRQLFVGKNPEVARLSGINVARVKIGAFVLTGCFSTAAGIMLAGSSGSANPTSGLSYLLPAFAAAFLGATTTVSGQFTAIGTTIAVYFLVSGTAGLAILGVPTFIQQVFYGVVLVVAVAASRLLQARRLYQRRAG